MSSVSQTLWASGSTETLYHCVCVCMYIHVYVFLSLQACTSRHVYVCVVCMHVCARVVGALQAGLCVCVRERVCVHLHVYVYICEYVCVCVS